MTRLFAVALALSGSVAVAQTPPAGTPPVNLAVPPPAAPAAPVAALDPKLVNHLNAWEDRQKQVQSLSVQATQVNVNKLTKKESTRTGTVTVLKPNMVYSMMALKTDPKDYIAFIGDGRSVFVYVARDKAVTEHKMPKTGGVDGNLMLEFLSGSLTAADVARRFDLKLVREEPFYIQIQVIAKLPKDLQEFDSMLLVLYTPEAAKKLGANVAYLPKIVRMSKQNGQEDETWTFDDDQKINNRGVTPAYFKYQEPPPGWVRKQAPAR